MKIYVGPAFITVKTRSNSSHITDPNDLIHLVANDEATANQRRLFDYNVLHNENFRSEIYYQRKTYKLNEAYREERRLFAAYERCIDGKGLPLAERVQSRRDPIQTSAPRRTAAFSGSSAPRESLSERNASGRGQAGGGSAAEPRIPQVTRNAQADERAGFNGFWRTSPEKESGSGGGQAKPLPPPTSHTHPSPVKRAVKTPEEVDIIDLVVRNAATMDQLDLFEHKLVQDKRFQRELVHRLEVFRERSAKDECRRLRAVINRIAIWNLFKSSSIQAEAVGSLLKT